MFGMKKRININDILETFYNITQSKYYKKKELLVYTKYKIKISDDFASCVHYKTEDINIKIEYYSGLGLNYCIVIDDILVYDDKWVHNVPNEMKIYVYSKIKEVNEYNKRCFKDYEDAELKIKEDKISQFNKDEIYLINKFKK